MKANAKKVIFSLVLLIGIFTLVGCGNKEEKVKTETKVKSNFKNPKEITAVTGDKGTVKATYENDGKYEETKSGDSAIIKNSEENFRIFFEYSTKTVKEAETMMNNFKKSTSYEVIESVKFGKYSGFAFVDAKYASAQVYLYLDKSSDTILVAKVSPVQSLKAAEEISNGKKAVDVLYNNENVQNILKSITYKK